MKAAYRSYKAGRTVVKIVRRILREGDDLRYSIQRLVTVCRSAAAGGYTDAGKAQIGEAFAEVWIEGEDVWNEIDRIF
jgi:hypothetical protein